MAKRRGSHRSHNNKADLAASDKAKTQDKHYHLPDPTDSLSSPVSIQLQQLDIFPYTIDKSQTRAQQEPLSAGGDSSPTMPKLKLTKKAPEDTPMVFSVFYGKPAQATSSTAPKHLKNVLFEVKVNGEFLETARKSAEEPRGRLWQRLVKRHDETEADMAQFREILHLATSHNDEVLELWGDRKCVFCNERPAVAVVYQPLCCTYDGYYALSDGDRLFALMLSLAKLTEGLDSHAKVRTAVGSSADVPYINGLAVPICSPDAECQRAANAGIGDLMRALGKGLFDEKEFWVGDSEAGIEDQGKAKDKKKKNKKKKKSVKKDKKDANDEGDQEKNLGQTTGSGFATDMAMYREAVQADEWEEDDVSDSSDEEDLISGKHTKAPIHERIPLRYTAIIGQPIIDGNSETSLKAGRLTCLAFTSRWESGLLSSAAINSSPKPFHLIASFHERFIMQGAEFRCAICPTPVLATTMVHRPISFKREIDIASSAQPIRQTMLKLLQYIGGKWKYPETKAALGYDNIHHINDFIVPICRPGSACEEAARIAAKKFIDKQVPPGAQVIYPDITPDTDLIGKWWVENAGKRPKLVVKKTGRGVMLETAETDKAKAKAIMANDKAIEIIRHDVEKKQAKDKSKAAAALPTTVATTSDAELEKQMSRTYTYILDEGKAKEKKNKKKKNAAKKAPPTWGGYPLSERAARLVEEGENEKQLVKPMVTMELLNTLEDARKGLEEKYGADAIPK